MMGDVEVAMMDDRWSGRRDMAGFSDGSEPLSLARAESKFLSLVRSSSRVVRDDLALDAGKPRERSLRGALPAPTPGRRRDGAPAWIDSMTASGPPGVVLTRRTFLHELPSGAP